MTKKTIIYIAFSVLGLVLLKFAFTYFYNEWVISKYNDGYYKENFTLLENMNFTERYIVYYNNGNVSTSREIIRKPSRIMRSL